MADTRVVDQNVDPAHPFDADVDGALIVVRDRHVRPDPVRSSLRRNRCDPRLVASREHDVVSPLLCQTDERLPNPPGSRP